MKKIAILLVMGIVCLGFNACDDEDQLVFTATPDPEGVSFTNSFSSIYILTAATGPNLAERFVWNEVNMGVPTNISYELQGASDATFEIFDVIGTTTKTELGITVNQMLGLAEAAGLDSDPETENPNSGELYFRLRAYAGDGEVATVEQLSAVQTLAVTLLENTGEEEEPPVRLRELFFVGNATAADWNNDNNNPPLFRDPDDEDIYYFRGYFVANDFKLLEMKGQWQPQWGTNDGTTLSVNDGTGEDPGSFTIEATGYYDFEVNLLENSFTLTANEDALVEYPTIGVIGNGTNPDDVDGDGTPDGWQSDMDLTQSTFDPHLWYMNGVTLYDGEIKFRADDDWSVNWGSDTALSGQGTFDGPNIPVTAGTYDVWFNDLDGRYILIPVE